MSLLDDPVFRVLDDCAQLGDQVAKETLERYRLGHFEEGSIVGDATASARDSAIIFFIGKRALVSRPVLVRADDDLVPAAAGETRPIAVTDPPAPTLTDAEISALVAIVNGDAAACHVENCIAAERGHGFMSFQSAAYDRLLEEMRRRKIL